MSAMPPSAQALTQLLAGAWLAQAIAVIAKLGVADLLSAGPRTPAELASATGSEATAMYRVLRALAGAGIFVELADFEGGGAGILLNPNLDKFRGTGLEDPPIGEPITGGDGESRDRGQGRKERD